MLFSQKAKHRREIHENDRPQKLPAPNAGSFFALEKKKNVLLTVIPSRDYYRVKEGIRMIDKKAFFVATDSYEVKGAR